MLYANYSVPNEIRSLINSMPGRQRNKAVNHLVTLVQLATPERREVILDQMLTTIQKLYIESGRPLRSGEAFNQLGAKLSEQAFEQGDLKFIAKYFALVKTDPSDSKFWARMVLCVGFYRYVGSSLELSLRFCRMIFREMATLVSRNDQAIMAGGESHRLKPTEDTVTASALLFSAASAGDHENGPQKLWLLRLIEAVDVGHRESEELVCSIIEILEMTSAMAGIRLAMLSEDEILAMAPSHPMERARYLFTAYTDKPRLVLPSHHLAILKKLHSKIWEKADRDISAAEEFGKWFEKSYPKVCAHFEACRQQIEDHPRYGIRPFGYDSVSVRVSVLKLIGITGFAFHTEGECFPDVKLELYVKKTGVGLCTLYAFYRKAELHCTDELLDNWQGFDQDYLRAVLEFIIMDAMHRIVCKDSVVDESGERVTRSVAKRDVAHKQHQVVRPFLRRLPSGWKASDDARKRAFLHFGWGLPEGITFVQSHERWVDQPVEKPAPVFIYTDDYIKRVVEG